MPDPHDLEIAEKHLRAMEEIAPEDSAPSLGAVADLVKTLQDADEANVVYRCHVHATPKDCEIAHLTAAMSWADKQTAYIDASAAATAYYEEFGAYRECHS